MLGGSKLAGDAGEWKILTSRERHGCRVLAEIKLSLLWLCSWGNDSRMNDLISNILGQNARGIL